MPQPHHGERIFYVAPWLTRLSGLTMPIARLCRRVWGVTPRLLRPAEHEVLPGIAPPCGCSALMSRLPTQPTPDRWAVLGALVAALLPRLAGVQ